MGKQRRRLWLSALLCYCASLPLYGQEATPVGQISGTVVDTVSGQPVMEASISISELDNVATRTDLRGRFSLRDVPVGTYTLVVFKAGYRFSEISEVEVTADDITTANVPLEPRSTEPEDDDVFVLASLVVEAEAVASGESILLYNRRRSSTVTDAISEDRFSALGIGDAAQALSKTVGTTIVDGQYAVIRGLGDRYTNTQLNGLSVPSADPDRLAVQLDQFPADLLESVVTSKTFTADQPGAFSGGSVNMRTKSFPDRFFVKVGGGIEVNSRTTGEKVLNIPGAGRDWLGRDNGTRALPADAPEDLSQINGTLVQLFARRGDFGPADALQDSVELFDNRPYYPGTTRAQPDFGMSFSVGDRFDFGREQVLGYILALTYDRGVSHREGATVGRYTQGSVDIDSPNFVDLSRVFSPDPSLYTFYEAYLANPLTPLGEPPFGETRTAFTVDWGAYGQLSWKPSNRHEFNLRIFHNQSAEDAIKRGVGEATRSDSGEMRENYDLLYTERGVTSFQLAGESLLSVEHGLLLEWRGAVSSSYQDQPDYRSTEFKYDFRSGQYDPSGVNAFRYFREMDEDNQEFAVDLSLPLELANEGGLSLKAGLFWSDSERRNRERRFKVEGFQANGDSIPIFPSPVGILERGANFVRIGTYMQEQTSNANYDGEREISAGYLMADWRINYTWRLIAGARLERTDFLVVPTRGELGILDQDDLLPHASLVYSMRDDMNLRLSYGSTLARPTFREKADITLPNPYANQSEGGDPGLQMTEIDNYDLRWEWFPEENEVLSVSLFYKELKNPIEKAFIEGRILPQNIEQGSLIGVELEYRQSLGRWHERLAAFSMGMNFSWIDSEVDVSAEEFAAIRQVDPDADSTRPLFGQSPYIFNLDLSYTHEEFGSNVSLVFNVSGERLDLVNTGALPDVFEQPFPTLDLFYSQRLSERWSFKFSAKNLLDPAKEATLEHRGTTYLYGSYRRGRSLALSFSYNFN
jgi:hypothetical protein